MTEEVQIGTWHQGPLHPFMLPLESLLNPWKEPPLHRLPNPERGKPAIIAPGRCPNKWDAMTTN